MKVTVNDVELDLAPGTSAIDAVFAAGHDVPYFCSQEYMSPIGACRMCLARVGAPRKDRASGEWILDPETGEPQIFFFPNLMATCTTAVMEGMLIDTLSEPVKQAQNSMVEFTLINHPLDCPVCDKGGACELQDRAYEYGSGRSRFVFDKRHQEKHHALSELITLDRERCIHCKRCVRYFEEVPGDEVLDFIERGGHTYIGTIEEGLPSYFSGNITDICPVGALLDSTSRFRGRNWEYDHTRTTSLDDASGSALIVDARTGRIERVKAGLNPEVNKSWIDDGTRFGHEYADADERIRTPLLRRGGALVPASWEEAADFIAERLATLEGDRVGIVLRADATIEEGQAARALAEQLNSGRLDHAPRPPASLIGADPATLAELASADALLVVADVTEEVPTVDLRIKDALKGVAPPTLLAHGVPIADLRLKERMPRKREILTVAAPYRVDLMKHAGRTISYPAGGERALFEALTAAIASGGEAERPSDAEALAAQLGAAERAVVVLGAQVLASREAGEAALSFAKAVGAKTMLLGPMANSYGLEQIAVLPSHERYAYPAMLADAQALIVSGLNPAGAAEAAEALAGLELLVVHDSFENETTALADVVLPAKTGYEKDGTVVNLEGRYLPVRPAPVEAGLSEDMTGLVRWLGEALGVRLEGRSVRSARRVLKRLLDIDLAELPDGGLVAPRRPKRAAAVSVQRSDARAGEVLLVPTVLRHEFLERNPQLHAAFGDAALRLHPDDAAERGLATGDEVRLTVGGMARRARVQLSEGVPPGLLLLPALPEQPAGLAPLEAGSLVLNRELEAAP